MRKVLAVFLCIMLLLQPVTPVFAGDLDKLSFSDIKGHWAEDIINKHYQMGMLKGYPDGTFKPDQKMRRAELTALINRYFGLKEEANSNFVDVTGKEWYAEDAAKAKYYNYIEDLRLRPEESATREDVINMVSMIIDIEEQKVKSDEINFTDLEGVDERTKERIEKFSELGYINGYGNNTFKPKETINRAEIMTIVENSLGYIVQNQQDLNNLPKGVEKVTVINPNILIENKDIKGDLYISPGVNGKVIIKNSKVEGQIEIAGGSTNNPIEIENVETKKVVVTKAKEDPKVEIKGQNKIEKVKTKSESKVEISGETEIKEVITKAKTDLKLGDKTKITTLTTEGETRVEAEKGSKIEKLETKTKTEITGEGEIDKAYLKDKNDVEIEIKPKYTKVDNDKHHSSGGGGGSSSGSSNDTTSPSVSNGKINIDNVTKDSVDLAWEKASDNKTAKSELKYRVYYSTSNNLGTVENIEKGTAVEDYEKDITTKKVTGLDENTKYYFNVIVKDEAGNKSAYKVNSCKTEKNKPKNNDPVAENDEVEIDENETILIDVLNNDSDKDGDSLEITDYTQGKDGEVKEEDNKLRYTPESDYVGEDSFTYIISDGNGGTAEAKVSVTINEVIIPTLDTTSPSVSSGKIKIDNVTDASADLAWKKAKDNETDQENLKYKVYYSTANNIGTVTDAIYKGTSVENYEKDITTKKVTGLNEDTEYYFNVIVKDEAGNKSAYKVNSCKTEKNKPKNNDPVAENDEVEIDENETILIDVLNNDSDEDKDSLEITDYTNGKHGKVKEEDNKLRYKPNADYVGEDSFIYTISDGNGGTAEAKVSVTINEVIIPDTTSPSVSNGKINIDNVTKDSVDLAWKKASDNKTDESELKYRVYYSTTNNLDTVENIEKGTAIGDYEKDINKKTVTGLNEDTEYYFNVIVKDEAGNKSAYKVSSCKTEKNKPKNNDPVAEDDSAEVDENKTILIDVLNNDSDKDKDSLEITEYTNGEYGEVKEEDNKLCYTPKKDYTGEDSFTYTISDGNGGTATAKVNVTINEVIIPDTTSPSVSNGKVNIDNVTENSVNLSWEEASDNKTAKSELKYRVYYSTINNLDTVEKIEKGTSVEDYEKDITTKKVTGLNEDTEYYFNVIVKDEAGNKSVYEAVSTSTLIPVTVTEIKIKQESTQTNYIEGEKLDLTGLEITLTKSDNSTEDVAFDNFVQKNIITDPKHGKELTLADTTVKISIGSLTVDQNIIVRKPAEMEGKGTEDNPYLVESIEDLVAIGRGLSVDGVNDYSLSASYKLIKDLDFEEDESYQDPNGEDRFNVDDDESTTTLKDALTKAGGKGFEPIGKDDEENPITFKGTFDGDCHTISNLYINRHDHDVCGVGLFGYTNNATISNLGLLDVDVLGEMVVGGLVGYLSKESSVTNSYVTGTVECLDESGAGGLVGGNDGSTIRKSYAIANVKGQSGVGGLAGDNYNSTIENSYALGKVTGSGQIGALVGSNTKNTKIINSYATGTVKISKSNLNMSAGGLVGENISDSKILNSIAFSSSVNGNKDVGRVAGANNANGEGKGILTNNYAYEYMDIKQAGNPKTCDKGLNTKDGADITAEEFKDKDFYTDSDKYNPSFIWNFDNVWEIKDGADRPTLRGVGNDNGKLELPEVDKIPPTVENSEITISNPTETSVDLNWKAAKDKNGTDQENLEYRVYYSTSNNIETVEEILKNGTPVGEKYEKNITTKTVTELEKDTEYYFNVIVRDEMGNESAYVAVNESTKKPAEMRGTGEKGDPYLVESIEDLVAIGRGLSVDGVNDYSLSDNYKLIKDLDFEEDESYQDYNGKDKFDIDDNGDREETLKDVLTKADDNDTGKGFEPIGKFDNGSFSNERAFKGIFDGASHTISHLYINIDDYEYVAGLFGYTEKAKISNLGLIDVDIDVLGGTCVGGLVGCLIEGDVTNSYVTGTVKSLNLDRIGGLVGESVSSRITKSYAIANVKGESSVGGLVGSLVGSNNFNSTIENSYAVGEIIGFTEVGGLVGSNRNETKIINSYATGTVISKDIPADIYEDNLNMRVGGLVGENYDNSEILNSIAFSTSVNGDSNVGRVVGSIEPVNYDEEDGILINNYAYEYMDIKQDGNPKTCNKDLSTIDGADIAAKQFKDKEFYNDSSKWNTDGENSAWNFGDVWEIKSGAGRPTLKGVGNDDGKFELPEVDKTLPTVDNLKITISNPTEKSVDLSWEAATDNKTNKENLEYRVYYSTSNNIGTVEETLKNGTPVGEEYERNITTKTVTELEKDTEYYFNVIVRDEMRNKSAYEAVSGSIKQSAEMKGTGEKGEPYLVESIEDLVAIGRGKDVDGINDYSLSAHYKLNKDLDFKDDGSYQDPNGEDRFNVDDDDESTTTLKAALTKIDDNDTGKGFEPIGNNITPFTGTFDGSYGDGGDKHNIANLYINRPDRNYVGLFGYTKNATISKLSLKNVDITGNQNVGCLVGGCESSRISDSYINGGTVTGDMLTTGLVGSNINNSIIINSNARVSIENKGSFKAKLPEVLTEPIKEPVDDTEKIEVSDEDLKPDVEEESLEENNDDFDYEIYPQNFGGTVADEVYKDNRN